MDPLLTHSRQTIARGSKSFALASRLFDPHTRAHAMLLYAWCRHCDDQIDGQDLGMGQQEPDRHVQEQRLDAIARQTRSALAGEPQADPAFCSFQRVVRECSIPERFPLELLEGFAMDVRGEPYETLGDTIRYCYHVAGTVGAMMARVMGVTQNDTLTRGIHLGIALQLTNMARDVMDDARSGRVYLPARWLSEAGVAPTPAAVLEQPAAVARVVERLLEAAAPYYASASHGVARLPWRSAWAVQTASRVYGDIGNLVRQRGAQAWQQRVSVSAARKVGLLMWAGVEVGIVRRRLENAQPPEVSGLFIPAEPRDRS